MGTTKPDSWQQTYGGYIDEKGTPHRGFYTGKQDEIARYFRRNGGRKQDFRDFFSALGVMEGSDKYNALSETKTYHGIYQMGKQALDYIDFWNTYGKSLNVKDMDDFRNSPMAQETAALLTFMGTPGGRDSRFRATAKEVKNDDLNRYVKGGGTECDVTFVDKRNKDWQQTVRIKINRASVSAAAHLLGQGKMGKILDAIIAGHESDTPAVFDINDSGVYDGKKVLFTAYMQLTQDCNIDGVVGATPSREFDAYLSSLIDARKGQFGKASSFQVPQGKTGAPSAQTSTATTGGRPPDGGGRSGEPGQRPFKGANPPPPQPRPNRFLDILGKGLSDAYGSVREWLAPRPAPRGTAPSPVRTPTPPATRPNRRSGGERAARPATASAPAPRTGAIPPAAAPSAPVNQFGPWPLPTYAGAPRREATPPSPGPVLVPQKDDGRIKFDLPGTVGGADWLHNRLAALLLPPSAQSSSQAAPVDYFENGPAFGEAFALAQSRYRRKPGPSRSLLPKTGD